LSVIVVFDAFEELMSSHHDVPLSFSEIHMWIKRVLYTHGRYAQNTKEVDQGQSECPPHHHITFGPKMKRDQIQHVLELDSDCMTWAQRSIAPHT
jgi:hypothetical protein